MSEVHPNAIVDAAAELGDGVEIGPFCCVGPSVKLGDGVVLKSHVVVEGRTSIGEGSVIYPFASIGQIPQDLKYAGEDSELVVGEHNTIREYATMNPGTKGGGMVTRIGDHNLFMIGAHVAHDCQIGNNVIMANNATLAGHVIVGDYAIIGGLAAVHQFVRIGPHAMIGGMSGVEHDIIPYGSVMGGRAWLSGLNLVGLKRRGFSKDDIGNLRTAYRLLFAEEGVLRERIADVADRFGDNNAVMDVVDFMRTDSPRGLTQPQSMHGD